MITSIDKLEKLGIYRNISFKTCHDFNRYNLIYGWNGSGKSTLSRLFTYIGGQKTAEDFENIKVSVTCDGVQYNEKQFPLSSETILVFNEDFINDNINWNGTIKSILLLDEGNIDDAKKYEELKAFLYGKDEDEGEVVRLNKQISEVQKDEAGLQKILTNIGKTVKNNYQILDTGDTYYLNYDKRKVQNLLDEKNAPLSEADLLNSKELDLAIKQAKPIKKNKIEYTVTLKKKENLEQLVDEINEIISRKVVANVIEELKTNQSLSDWVKTGMELHKNEQREVCAFCGNVIRKERIDELEAHFSDALKKLSNDIEVLVEKLEEIKCDEEVPFGDISIYYEELATEISEYNIEYKEKSKLLNAEISNYIQLLDNKKNNPFDVAESVLRRENISDYCEGINSILKKYIDVIQKHNTKTDTFEESTRLIKRKIERHYVQEQLKGLSYRKRVDEYNKKKVKIENDSLVIKKKTEEYNYLEGKLSNETLGAEEFNQKLERFLGYDEIKLKFDANAKGYKIYRNLREEAEHLSEGEKTAIAFIYFVTKIKEGGRRIEDCIIVIDDPISSFDSNKLFSSYAYTKSECESAKQLFVLTHNYNYFSLVLGWFNKRNRKDPVSGKKIADYSLYRVENKFVQGKREAILSDAGESLKQATEYDYVFFTVFSMRNVILTKKESIFCGNICRKLVESFLSFKFPKQRADLMALLNAALPGKENDIVRERIYKFINIYSHDKKINVFEELDAEILDANSQQIIQDILKMINNLDPVHYNAMVEKFRDEE